MSKNELLKKLNFEYNLNHKVYGFLDEDEAHELIYEGVISKLLEPTYPQTVGIFDLYVFDIEKSKDLNRFEDLVETIKDYSNENNCKFTNFDKIIFDEELNCFEYDRIIFLSGCVFHPNYRGKGILKELIKSVYLTHFTKNSLFILNATPIQNLKFDYSMLLEEYPIEVCEGTTDLKFVDAGKYFKINELPEEDEEYEYKLYAKMLNMNFEQFYNTGFFYQNSKENLLKLFKK